jgi:hypothetical protein
VLLICDGASLFLTHWKGVFFLDPRTAFERGD